MCLRNREAEVCQVGCRPWTRQQPGLGSRGEMLQAMGELIILLWGCSSYANQVIAIKLSVETFHMHEIRLLISNKTQTYEYFCTIREILSTNTIHIQCANGILDKKGSNF